MPPERQFVDDGISGATLVRPALDRLRDLAAVGAIDRVYVHSPDRLARNYAYQVLLFDEWRRANVEVVFLNRSLGQSPEDDLLLQMQGIIAEYQRAKFMERSRRGKRHAAQGGSLNVMSGAPFGYRYISVREGGGQARFEQNAEQARVVQRIFSWIGRDRCSLNEVCRRLQKAGELTASGRRVWSKQVVWHILQNPAYVGRAAYGKTRMMPRPATELLVFVPKPDVSRPNVGDATLRDGWPPYVTAGVSQEMLFRLEGLNFDAPPAVFLLGKVLFHLFNGHLRTKLIRSQGGAEKSDHCPTPSLHQWVILVVDARDPGTGQGAQPSPSDHCVYMRVEL